MVENDSLHEQLLTHLKQQIINGEYQLGQKLPSERALAEKFKINRLTVRKALKKLQDEKCITIRKGKGTYVNGVPLSRKLELGSAENISLKASIEQKGMRPSRQIISFNKIETSKTMQAYFPDTNQLYELIRLSLINEVPYAVQEAYFPGNIFANAEEFDFIHDSLYAYFRQQGHAVDCVDTNITVTTVPQHYSEILQTPDNKYLFLIIYRGFTKDGHLIEYTNSYHLSGYTTLRYEATQ